MIKQLCIVILSDQPDVISPEVLAGPAPAQAPRFLRALHAAYASATAAGAHISLANGAEEAYNALQERVSPEPLQILFAVQLPAAGINHELVNLLRMLRNHPQLPEHATGAVLMDGEGPLYTKSSAAQLVFAANSAGCAFIGRPLVEATGDLSNFHVIAENLGTDLEGAYLESVRDLVTRLLSAPAFPANKTGPKLLALHASSRETSNTLALWHATREKLTGIETREISLRNGTLSDCEGCPFEMCLHFGEQDSCFYGGVMVEEVYPALREADAVLMVCPNYNDAIGANLTAFINRLTAMYRAHPFSDKALFAIVVSGYSGSDMLAAQLVAALNMNKSFYLPPRFALIATAHTPGSAMRIPGIDAQIGAFAQRIQNVLR